MSKTHNCPDEDGIFHKKNIRMVRIPDGRWFAAIDAATTSEARAQAKDALGIKVLPTGTVVDDSF